MSATWMSVKSRVAAPAHAELARSADFALSSALPVGWSCRSRSPVELPRNADVIECSAKPYSLRPAAAAASKASPSAPTNWPNTPGPVLRGGSSQRGLSSGLPVDLAGLDADPGHGADRWPLRACSDCDHGQPAGSLDAVGRERVAGPVQVDRGCLSRDDHAVAAPGCLQCPLDILLRGLSAHDPSSAVLSIRTPRARMAD